MSEVSYRRSEEGPRSPEDRMITVYGRIVIGRCEMEGKGGSDGWVR